MTITKTEKWVTFRAQRDMRARVVQPKAVEVCIRVTMDASYPTGGETLDYTEYGITTLESVQITAISVAAAAPSGIYQPLYDATNKKILLYGATADGSSLVQVANTTDVSSQVFDVTFRGYV